MPNFDRARGDTPFKFEAPDDGFGIEIVNVNGFAFGPVGNFEDGRKAEDVGAALAGGRLQPRAWCRGQVRAGRTFPPARRAAQGGDRTQRLDRQRRRRPDLPRRRPLAVLDRPAGDLERRQLSGHVVQRRSGRCRAQRAAGVRCRRRIQAYGATMSFLTQFSKNWGVSTYAKYDRLTGDAADSPIVLTYGSRDQFSFGAALTYTFGPGLN
jgi:hypothetical protein